MKEIKPIITADILDAVDVRVGTIREVSDVEQSSKLVRLTVDFGDFRRNILAGKACARWRVCRVKVPAFKVFVKRSPFW